MGPAKRLGRWWRRTRGRRRVPVRGYWQRYLKRLAAESQSADTPIEHLRFVVIDTETTGLDHRTDQVVSFAAVRVRGGEISVSEAVDWRVRAGLPSPGHSIEIHGVLNGELESGLPEARFVELLVDYVGAEIIVGYRPGFDMAILNRVVREHTGGRVTNPTLDVFDLGMRVDYPLKPRFVNPEPYRLDAMCVRYGIENPERHTALGDAYVTALLLLKLLYRLQESGLRTRADLMRRYP